VESLNLPRMRASIANGVHVGFLCWSEELWCNCGPNRECSHPSPAVATIAARAAGKDAFTLLPPASLHPSRSPPKDLVRSPSLAMAGADGVVDGDDAIVDMVVPTPSRPRATSATRHAVKEWVRALEPDKDAAPDTLPSSWNPMTGIPGVLTLAQTQDLPRPNGREAWTDPSRICA